MKSAEFIDALKSSNEGQAFLFAWGYLLRNRNKLSPEGSTREKAVIHRRATQSLFRNVKSSAEGAPRESLLTEWLSNMVRGTEHGAIDEDSIKAVLVELINDGEPIPEVLRGFAVHALLEKPKAKPIRKRGPQTDLHHRNLMIGRTVLQIVEKYKLAPTRNRASQKVESACSIVARALGMVGQPRTEAAVEKIWEQSPLRPKSKTDTIRTTKR